MYIDDEESDESKIKLPEKLIAMSFMVNDKFPFARAGEDDFYDYLGIRATSNASYTSTIKRTIANSIMQLLTRQEKIDTLKEILNFLGMDHKIDITYYLNRRTLFKADIPDKRVKEIAQSIIKAKKYIKESELNYISLNPEVIRDDINRVRSVSSLKSFKIHISIDLSLAGNISEHNFSSLARLERLEFISSPDVNFYKNTNYSFDETSSGEKNILSTVINLVSRIKENSLVLIDEPEISLHPVWQMKYIEFIKKSIESTPGCHLILASHSHFMVSDLESKSSSIVSIYQDDKSRKCEHIDYSTYAWSVENILYKIFHLRTTRNSQVEMDLYELTSLISRSKTDKKRVKDLISNLEKIKLDNNDHLNIIIDQGKSFIGGEN